MQNSVSENMKLKEQLGHLEKIINKNIELYDDMKERLEVELEALKAHSFSGIESSVKRKMEIAHEIKTLEIERLKALEILSLETGIPEKEISLSRLAKLVGGETGSRLEALKVRFRDVVGHVTEMNTFNQGVIERLMKINYDSAARLKELIEPEETYKKSGSSGQFLRAGHVVSKKM